MNKILLKCVGCSNEYSLDIKSPIHGCEHRGKDTANHLLEKILPEDFSFNITNVLTTSSNSNPYLIFRKFFFSYYLAKKFNIDFMAIVSKIDEELKKMGEVAFEITPLIAKDNIEDIHGLTLIKNETINVSGSHKARHLMGNILYLEVLNKCGIIQQKPKLAIYSCGNAALGAAAVAKSAKYKLDVFIPEHVNPNVIKKLNSYGANIVECPRIPGEKGDPCYNRFQEAIASGSVPFSCSGPDNWSNLEGGQTLCLELMAQASLMQQKIDAIVIQVGGGALASSAIKTLEELFIAGSIDNIPTIYTVQTESAYPLLRAYLLIIKEIALKNNLECSLDNIKDVSLQNKKFIEYYSKNLSELLKITSFIKNNYLNNKVQDILIDCTKNVSKYMWAWENEPHSIAHGILDDITYDFFKIIQGLLRTGGIPITVTEQELKDANTLAKKSTQINADCTGSSGFAGYLKLKKLKIIPDIATTVVFFTGVER